MLESMYTSVPFIILGREMGSRPPSFLNVPSASIVAAKTG